MAAYLDDVIVFDPNPTAHVKTIQALLELLRKPSLKLSHSKACLGATDSIFVGNYVSLGEYTPYP